MPAAQDLGDGMTRSSVGRGFGYAAGFALFRIVAGLTCGAVTAIWLSTGKAPVPVKLLLRGALVAGAIVLLAILFSDL
jgi:hypothetical protein